MASTYLEVFTQGLLSAEVSGTANTTTTSTTDVVFTGATNTPPAGTYLVIYSTWLTHGTGNATITMSMYNNAVQKADSVRTIIPFVGALSAVTQDIPVTLNGLLTVNGAQAIDIRWRTSGGTATAHQWTLNLIKLA